MAEQDDLFVAKHALQQRDVSREQLQETLLAMVSDWARQRPLRPLGTMLVEKGHLSQSRLQEILTSTARFIVPGTLDPDQDPQPPPTPPPGRIPEEASRTDSIKLGQLLALMGIVSYSQVMEALLAQEESRDEDRPRMRIGEYLVSMGYTTAHAIQRALSYQSKSIYSCRACNLHFNIVNARAKQAYQCNHCQGELVSAPEAVGVAESMKIEPLRPSPERSAPAPLSCDPETFPMYRLQADRAAALHIQQYQLASAAALRDAEYWQIELGTYGLFVPLLDVLTRLDALPGGVAEKIRGVDFIQATTFKLAVPGYRIFGKVAATPLCTSYVAQPEFTPTPVGLKVLHPDLWQNDANVARFRYDASLLMRFDHPGLVKGYECGYAPLEAAPGAGIHYAVLEYVQGCTLDHLLRLRGRLPPATALGIAQDLTSALTYLQREGFLHGDLRPEHVLVDERRRARLIDVGRASPYDRSTRTDPRVGAEITALGQLLWSMLSGLPPEGVSPRLPTPAELARVEMSSSLRNALAVLLTPAASARFNYLADVLTVLQAAT